MTEKEFLDKKRKIEKRASDEKQKLYQKYAMSNNPYEIDDIIFDHVCTIKIGSIGWSFPYGRDLPVCVYHGQRYTKKGVPVVQKEVCDVWQSNVRGKL